MSLDYAKEKLAVSVHFNSNLKIHMISTAKIGITCINDNQVNKIF